jgi:hypothetical protein
MSTAKAAATRPHSKGFASFDKNYAALGKVAGNPGPWRFSLCARLKRYDKNHVFN